MRYIKTKIIKYKVINDLIDPLLDYNKDNDDVVTDIPKDEEARLTAKTPPVIQHKYNTLDKEYNDGFKDGKGHRVKKMNTIRYNNGYKDGRNSIYLKTYIDGVNDGHGHRSKKKYTGDKNEIYQLGYKDGRNLIHGPDLI